MSSLSQRLLRFGGAFLVCRIFDYLRPIYVRLLRPPSDVAGTDDRLHFDLKSALSIYSAGGFAAVRKARYVPGNFMRNIFKRWFYFVLPVRRGDQASTASPQSVCCMATATYWACVVVISRHYAGLQVDQHDMRNLLRPPINPASIIQYGF